MMDVAAGPRPPVEDITSGVKEACSISKILDYISHNHGLSLCESMLPVLSVQHASIFLIRVRQAMRCPACRCSNVYSNGAFPPFHMHRWCVCVYSCAKYLMSDNLPSEVQPFIELWFT